MSALDLPVDLALQSQLVFIEVFELSLQDMQLAR